MPSFDANAYINSAREKINNLLGQSGTIRIAQLREQLQDSMSEHCGVFRTEETMQAGLERLQELKAQYQEIYLDDQDNCWNTELIEALELRSLLIVGETILTSALNRQESRGAHSREDYPQRNDEEYLRHTLAYYSSTGIEISYMPVVINRFEPQERKY